MASSPVAIRIDARLPTTGRPTTRGQRPLPARTFAVSRADLRHREEATSLASVHSGPQLASHATFTVINTLLIMLLTPKRPGFHAGLVTPCVPGPGASGRGHQPGQRCREPSLFGAVARCVWQLLADDLSGEDGRGTGACAWRAGRRMSGHSGRGLASRPAPGARPETVQAQSMASISTVGPSLPVA